MPLVLVSQTAEGGGAERTHSLEQPEIFIDRSLADRHAVVRTTPHGVVLVDLGFGASVGGVRLREGVPRLLHPGDVLRVGRVRLTLESVDTELPSSVGTRELALRGAQRLLAHDTVPVVVVVEGSNLGQALRLGDDERVYIVGRGDGGDLVLDDDDVSREHLAVTSRRVRVTLRDLGSTQGTHLGAVPLESDAEALWSPPGRMVRVGRSVLALREPPPAPSFDDLVVPEGSELGDALLGEADATDEPAPLPAEDGAGGSTAPIAAPAVAGGAVAGAAPVVVSGSTARGVWERVALLATVVICVASAVGIVWLIMQH